jgi:hypothetical protein
MTLQSARYGAGIGCVNVAKTPGSFGSTRGPDPAAPHQTHRSGSDLRFAHLNEFGQDRGLCLSSPVPDHDPGLWLAGPAGPQPAIQGCRDHGPPSRGHGAPPSGHPPKAGLHRPGGPGSTGPAAASRTACPPACHARNPAGLAPSSHHTQNGPARTGQAGRSPAGRSATWYCGWRGEPGRGYHRVPGELTRRGHDVSAATVRRILRARVCPPAPRPRHLLAR